MGILRADRISGLGGANAITGSVNFTNDGVTSKGDYLRVDRKDNSDFNLSTNDFTIEFWMYSRNVGASLHLVTFAASTVSASSDAGFYVRQYGGVVQGYCFEGNNSIGVVATGSLSIDKWYHIAYVRSGSTFTMYLDGTSTATASSAEAANFDASWNLNIGSAYTDVYHYNGYLSNLRIVNGTAIYTSNFTPNTRLTNVENTVLLACQSCGNVLQEGTNKTIHLVRDNNDNTTPQATHFTPNSPVGFSTTTDAGSQYGSTFDGFGSFVTSTYMVPPGGNTRERNRGRAVVGGGYDNPNVRNEMDYFNIQSMGNAVDFGNLTTATFGLKSNAASSTRGIIAVGGRTPSYVNTIEFITIASTSNATDFGDTSATGANIATSSNQTRGILMGGRNPTRNTIEFITIATTGNASDFGDLTAAKRQGPSLSSPTRAIYAGGFDDTNRINNIEFVTIASAGNAADFGDLTDARQEAGGASDNTRGVFAGGYDAPARVNIIDYITMASAGNAIDFGDTQTALTSSIGSSNNTRGVFPGYNDGGRQNTIYFVTIQTTGDAQDFGDLTVNRSGASCCSDSHGGL